MIEENTILKSLNTESRTNAMVASVSTEGLYTILTDFGNLLHMYETEVKSVYTIPDWFKATSAQYAECGLQVETAVERIDLQIDRLQASKAELLMMGG